MYYYQKNSAGFSLVETLVAITILLLVVIGPLTITARTAKSSTFASEQVVAQFLAQEGVELAQKMRDDYVLGSSVLGGSNPDAWADFVATPYCFTTTGCGLEIGSDGSLGTIRDCTTIADCRLNLNTATGARALYTHTSTSNASPYTRVIKMTVSSPQEVKIESVVTWRTGSLVANQQVRVETALFNIYGI